MRNLIRTHKACHHNIVLTPSSPHHICATTRLTDHPVGARETRRSFSDKLLGYSPMAQGSPTKPPATAEDGKPSRMPTAKEVSLSGGVWAPTSAKRDKLTELKIELEEDKETLDDAATPEQLQDLYLSDGIQLIAKTVDSIPDNDTKEIQELSDWLVEQQGLMPENVDQTQFESHLTIISEKVSSLLSEIPPSRCLRDIRDFFDPSEAAEEELQKIKGSGLSLQDKAFERAVVRFRLLLTQAAVEHLKESWTVLTTISDGDVDRAAVKGEKIEPQMSTIPVTNVYKFLYAHTSGTCADRVDVCWELLDHDGDGLLDESEMNNVALLCLTPVQSALVTLFQEALEAYPVRALMPEIGDEPQIPEPKGWQNRRKEAKAKKLLLKMFQNSCKNHFEDEVEINHRLRCVYGWAEKKHQGNKLESILVDDGWSSRKRYVELSPKVSLPEFREVQKEHFGHLDQMGKEILSSFREDLWVLQGKGRQNRELMRDCFAFLTVVSVLDYLILVA